MRLSVPDYARLRDLYVELEFHSLARNVAGLLSVASAVQRLTGRSFVPAKTSYKMVDSLERLHDFREKRA